MIFRILPFLFFPTLLQAQWYLSPEKVKQKRVRVLVFSDPETNQITDSLFFNTNGILVGSTHIIGPGSAFGDNISSIYDNNGNLTTRFTITRYFTDNEPISDHVMAYDTLESETYFYRPDNTLYKHVTYDFSGNSFGREYTFSSEYYFGDTVMTVDNYAEKAISRGNHSRYWPVKITKRRIQSLSVVQKQTIDQQTKVIQKHYKITNDTIPQLDYISILYFDSNLLLKGVSAYKTDPESSEKRIVIDNTVLNLIDSCTCTDTYFSKKQIHKITWICPNDSEKKRKPVNHGPIEYHGLVYNYQPFKINKFLFDPREKHKEQIIQY